MNANIIFEISCYLLLFYLCFYFYFSKSKDYKFQRFYLVTSLFLAVLIPYIPVGNLVPETIFNVNLSPVVIGGDAIINKTTSSSSFNIFQVLFPAYITVCTFFLIRLIISLALLFRMKSVNHNERHEHFNLIRAKGIKSAFSFFNNIFIPYNHTRTSEELELIIRHEKMHIELGHSQEKLFLELCKVVLWWHPIIHLMTISLNNIHEYEVDDLIIQANDKKAYSEFLINCINEQPKLLVNTISSNIKNRIIMMYTSKNNMSLSSKISGLFVLLLISLLLHSCQKENKIADTDSETESITAKEMDKSKAEKVVEVDTIITFDLETNKESMKIVSRESDVYKVVEQMPQFPGCEEISDVTEQKDCATKNLLEYVYGNIKYPSLSRQNGVDGLVVCSFVIDENGALKNEKIIRSPNDELGESVLSMLNKMKTDIVKWNPGMQSGKNVKVQFTLPVKFKLD